VTHVDDAFLSQLTQLYRLRISAGSAVLDVGASHVSHLPPELPYTVVGTGLNAEELSRNPRLSRFFVRNLNSDPSGWALPDASFDAVTCCVSVQYFQQPERVFAEFFRVLKPGGVCIVSFSSRLFYGKAIAAWRDGSGYSRAQLVKQYFGCVAGFTQPEVVTAVEVMPDESLFGKLKQLLVRSSGDPFYAVIAYRNYKPVS
jgi:SAM-dependent methyltransferase